MARKSKREKQVEKAVEAAFNKIGKNRQFNIMDLGKISAAGAAAAGTEGDVDVAKIDAAVADACDKYEQKG